MNLYFAPLHGVTLHYYRNLHAQIFGGIDTYYAPFIVTTDARMSSPVLFSDFDPQNNWEGLNIIPQLLSNKSSEFNYYARTLADMGHKEINWNIGCPFSQVTHKKRGSGLLEDPDLIKRFMEGLEYTKDYEISIKMRLGYTDLEEGQEVIDILNQYPVSNLIIHARTGTQMYSGTANLEGFKTLYEMTRHNVVYNGDIKNSHQINHVNDLFPDLSEFMIGRGLIKNPFMAMQLKGMEINQTTFKTKISEFHSGYFDYFDKKSGDEVYVCAKMKEFWTNMSLIVDPTNTYLDKIRRSLSYTDYKPLAQAMIDSLDVNHLILHYNSI